MIAEKAAESIDKAVAYELQNSVKEHGAFYASEHEAYAVLLEEVEEVEEEAECIKIWLESVWKCIKGNQDLGIRVNEIKEHALDLAKEAVQVAAVCERFQETLDRK